MTPAAKKQLKNFEIHLDDLIRYDLRNTPQPAIAEFYEDTKLAPYIEDTLETG